MKHLRHTGKRQRASVSHCTLFNEQLHIHCFHCRLKGKPTNCFRFFGTLCEIEGLCIMHNFEESASSPSLCVNDGEGVIRVTAALHTLSTEQSLAFRTFIFFCTSACDRLFIMIFRSVVFASRKENSLSCISECCLERSDFWDFGQTLKSMWPSG